MRAIEITFPKDHSDDIRKIMKKYDDLPWSILSAENDILVAKTLIKETPEQQKLMDKLLNVLEDGENWSVAILPTQAVLTPETQADAEDNLDEKNQADQDQEQTSGKVLREEIYNQVSGDTQVTPVYLALISLSALVTTIGVNMDNTAVVIGGMVLAPLIGPLLGFSLGACLAHTTLIKRASLATLAGVALALLIAAIVAVFIDIDLESQELISRSHIGLDAVALGLASGAAAALSVTSRLSNTIVGVMVAVALLPPIAAVSLFAIGGEPAMAINAALLVITNIVCVVFACQITFFVQGISPRSYRGKKEAEKSSRMSFVFWGSLIIGLSVLIFLLTQNGVN